MAPGDGQGSAAGLSRAVPRQVGSPITGGGEIPRGGGGTRGWGALRLPPPLTPAPRVGLGNGGAGGGVVMGAAPNTGWGGNV